LDQKKNLPTRLKHIKYSIGELLYWS
jgi:hypothetical protein